MQSYRVHCGSLFCNEFLHLGVDTGLRFLNAYRIRFERRYINVK